jgi:multicomponent Na+:H+ antiporter subunit F
VHDLVLTIAIGWMVALLVVTVVAVLRAKTALVRVLALDATTLVLISMLILISAREDKAYYLDAALMLALLAFVSTLAAARYRASGRVF